MVQGRRRRGESREIDIESSNSGKGSEAAEGAVRQSEGIARLSVLRSLRQAVPRGHPRVRLPAVPPQRRCGGRGRGDLRGHRVKRSGVMAGPTGGGTQEEELSSRTGTSCMDPQAGRRQPRAGHPHHPGPRGPDGGNAGLGPDLRGGPAVGAVCLSSGAQCSGRRASGPFADQHRSSRGDRCGFGRILGDRFILHSGS